MQKDNASPSASHQNLLFIQGSALVTALRYFYPTVGVRHWTHEQGCQLTQQKQTKETLRHWSSCCTWRSKKYMGLSASLATSQVCKLYTQLVHPLGLKRNNHLSCSDLRTTGWGDHSLNCKEQCWWWTPSSYLTWHCHFESETGTTQNWQTHI